jgi:WD40 repeat protein
LHSLVAALVLHVTNSCLSASVGMVRVWRLGKQSQTMEASMKDHKGPVNCIVVKASTDDECVSASSDGSCIIWDLNAGRRRQVRAAAAAAAASANCIYLVTDLGKTLL